MNRGFSIFLHPEFCLTEAVGLLRQCGIQASSVRSVLVCHDERTKILDDETRLVLRIEDYLQSLPNPLPECNEDFKRVSSPEICDQERVRPSLDACGVLERKKTHPERVTDLVIVCADKTLGNVCDALSTKFTCYSQEGYTETQNRSQWSAFSSLSKHSRREEWFEVKRNEKLLSTHDRTAYIRKNCNCQIRTSCDYNSHASLPTDSRRDQPHCGLEEVSKKHTNPSSRTDRKGRTLSLQPYEVSDDLAGCIHLLPLQIWILSPVHVIQYPFVTWFQGEHQSLFETTRFFA